MESKIKSRDFQDVERISLKDFCSQTFDLFPQFISIVKSTRVLVAWQFKFRQGPFTGGREGCGLGARDEEGKDPCPAKCSRI